MNEQKMMQLTNEEAAKLFSKGCDTAVEANRMMDEFNNGGILIKPIESKLVHLSDLPLGTLIKYKDNGYSAYVEDGSIFSLKAANGIYMNEIDFQEVNSFELLPGKFQVWQGGPCPWPQYVEVEVVVRNGNSGIGQAVEFVWDYADSPCDDDIIAHRCTGRLLQGAKLVP